MTKAWPLLGLLPLLAWACAPSGASNSPSPVPMASPSPGLPGALMMGLDAAAGPLSGQVGASLLLAPAWYLNPAPEPPLRWEVLTPSTARVDGADRVVLLAPGAVRVRASKGQDTAHFLLAATSATPEAEVVFSREISSGQMPDAPPVGRAAWSVQSPGAWEALRQVFPILASQSSPDWSTHQLLVLTEFWANTNEVAPVVVTHRDAEGVWQVVTCDPKPVMLLASTAARLHMYKLPRTEARPQLRWHDRKGDRLVPVQDLGASAETSASPALPSAAGQRP